MRFIKITILSTLILILLSSLIFFFTRHLILAKIESTIIQNIEKALNRKIDVGGIAYIPYKGIALKDINVYEKGLPQEGLSINTVYLKIGFTKFIKSKQILATIRLEDIKQGNLNGEGMLIIESNPFKNILRPFKDFSLNTIRILHFNFFSPFIVLKNISGSIYFKEGEISSPDITFFYLDNPNKLSFYVRNLKTAPFMNVEIKGKNLTSEIQLRKKEELVKIEAVKFQYLDSYFEGNGEIQELTNPILLLHGTLKLNTKDICYIGPQLDEMCKYLQVDGIVDNEIYFRGRLNEPLGWEIASKGQSRLLRIWDYQLNHLNFDLRLKNGVMSIPLLTAYPYGGVLNLSSQVDLSQQNIPYAVSLRLKNLDMNGVAQDSELRNKNIYGLLQSELFLEGYNGDTRSIRGKGSVFISNGNLGPMPLLSPLLGHVYGVIRGAMPGLRTVEITGGACNFFIEDKKIYTNNLILWGDAINIKAKGYMDFDKNLNFEIENEFKEATEEIKEDWQKALLEIISMAGRFIGKAYLTGTLSKPKWKFEYFSNFEGALGGKIQDVLKGIFE